MSVKPSEEQGSEGRWFGEDFEKLDRFGSTVPRFDERGDEFQPENWEDESPEQKQCLYEPESNRQRPSVAMETASTGGNASLFDSLSSKGDSDLDLLMKSTDNDGDLYTSLLSSQNYSFQQDTSYFSGDMGGEAQKFPPPPARDRVPSPESHGAFNSDSGIEMTPGESIDVAKNLLESEKMEAYNYMDMSRGEEARPRQPETGPAGPGPYLEKRPPGPVETLGPALDSHAFPYVEDPSDEEPSDYQSYRALGTPQTASPIKITLTETPAAPASEARPQVSERESILSLGLEGVPTVTLSEPEDDSPGSVTPPLEEDFPDPLFQAREVKLVGSASDRAFSSALPPSGSLRQPGPQGKAKRASKPRPSQEDGSSAESGDSEIELVSEEPPSRPPPPGAGYASFGPAPAPPPAPSVQYSILREEREAELDSELIIESCDASSASEESPKREQDSPAPKGRGADAPLAYSFTAAPAPTPSPAPIPASVPAPVVPPASAARETQASDRSKSSVGTGNAPAAKPKPPAAVVPPEVRVEQPPPEEEPGWKTRRASEGKRELEGGAAAPAFLQGFSKQKAMDLLYWRDVKQTGVLFGSVLLLLFSLTQFSVVSVAAYLALAALSATISFRIYKSVLQAVQKTDEGHPFKSYLDMEISLSHDQIQKYADSAQLYANTTLKELRRLFLVQDLVDSLKFAVLMWLLTYVGALFNGLTLLILAVVSMFTMPVVYEKYQAQIDQYLGLIRTHVNSVVGKIQAKIPGAKRKAE